MQCNKYVFCGCSVEIKSDEYIRPKAEFSSFLSDYSSADYSIRIIRTDSLPQKNGEEVFVSDRRKIYFDGNRFIISALEVSEFWEMFKSNLSNILITLVITYLLKFVFVYILSLSV